MGHFNSTLDTDQRPLFDYDVDNVLDGETVKYHPELILIGTPSLVHKALRYVENLLTSVDLPYQLGERISITPDMAPLIFESIAQFHPPREPLTAENMIAAPLAVMRSRLGTSDGKTVVEDGIVQSKFTVNDLAAFLEADNTHRLSELKAQIELRNERYEYKLKQHLMMLKYVDRICFYTVILVTSFLIALVLTH
jgi:hypothetical protein